MGAFEILSLVFAALIAFLTYLLVRHKRREITNEAISIHDNVTIYLTREATVAILAQITDRTINGDVLFGHCKICTGYPKAFNAALPRAVARGVKVQAIVLERPESREFIEFLRGLDPQKVVVIVPTQEQLRKSLASLNYVSVFGIRKREALVLTEFQDAFIGVHIRNELYTLYIERAFDSVLNELKG